MRDQKMSKSIGNVVRPSELVDAFGADATRYCLMREMVFGLDAGFSEESFRTRINADLANDLGNLMSRVITMVHKYVGGKVPAPSELGGEEAELKEAITRLVPMWEEQMESFEVHKALQSVWEVLNMANKVIDTTAPWSLAKDPSQAKRLGDVLYVLLEALRVFSILVYPVMPSTGRRMQQALGQDLEKGLSLHAARNWGILEPGTDVARIPPLFPRLEITARNDKRKEKQVKKGNREKMSQKEESKDKKEGGEFISFETFQSVDLRVAEIVAAERIPKADRLLKLTVRCPEERTIVAGIAEHFSPEDLVGRQVIVVANLKPVKLRGVRSEGMMLVAKDGDGLHLTTVATRAEPGSKIS